MSFMKKLFNTAIVVGATIGSAVYLKKRKDERENNSDFEDSSTSNEKMVEFSKENDGSKVSITFNTKKFKSTADMAADKVLDATEKAKDAVAEKIGEDNMEKVKETAQIVKEKAKDVTDFAKEKAVDAKEFVVETIGEDNIQTVKDKMTDFVDSAKEKVYSTFSSGDDLDDFEDDFVEDINDFREMKSTTSTTVEEAQDTSEVTTEDDVFLDEELEEI